MSIRPIDQTSMVNRTQETASNRQMEISKGENIAYHKYLEREKNTLRSQHRVNDTKQAEDNIIKDYENTGSGYKENDGKDKETKENLEDSDKPVSKKIKNEYMGPRGNSVDIRI